MSPVAAKGETGVGVGLGVAVGTGVGVDVTLTMIVWFPLLPPQPPTARSRTPATAASAIEMHKRGSFSRELRRSIWITHLRSDRAISYTDRASCRVSNSC